MDFYRGVYIWHHHPEWDRVFPEAPYILPSQSLMLISMECSACSGMLHEWICVVYALFSGSLSGRLTHVFVSMCTSCLWLVGAIQDPCEYARICLSILCLVDFFPLSFVNSASFSVLSSFFFKISHFKKKIQNNRHSAFHKPALSWAQLTHFLTSEG